LNVSNLSSNYVQHQPQSAATWTRPCCTLSPRSHYTRACGQQRPHLAVFVGRGALQFSLWHSKSPSLRRLHPQPSATTEFVFTCTHNSCTPTHTPAILFIYFLTSVRPHMMRTRACYRIPTVGFVMHSHQGVLGTFETRFDKLVGLRGGTRRYPRSTLLMRWTGWPRLKFRARLVAAKRMSHLKYILIFKSASPRAFLTRNIFSAPPTNKMPLYVAPSDRLARFNLVDEPVTLNYTAGSVGAV